eukprot:1253545-Rhodomonas_salina.1
MGSARVKAKREKKRRADPALLAGEEASAGVSAQERVAHAVQHRLGEQLVGAREGDDVGGQALQPARTG